MRVRVRVRVRVGSCVGAGESVVAWVRVNECAGALGGCADAFAWLFECRWMVVLVRGNIVARCGRVNALSRSSVVERVWVRVRASGCVGAGEWIWVLVRRRTGG